MTFTCANTSVGLAVGRYAKRYSDASAFTFVSGAGLVTWKKLSKWYPRIFNSERDCPG